MVTGAQKALEDCEIKHAPLEVEIENLKEGVRRVEADSKALNNDVWDAINALRTTANRLDKTISDMNGKLFIIVGGGGIGIQLLMRYVLGGPK